MFDQRKDKCSSFVMLVEGLWTLPRIAWYESIRIDSKKWSTLQAGIADQVGSMRRWFEKQPKDWKIMYTSTCPASRRSISYSILSSTISRLRSKRNSVTSNIVAKKKAESIFQSTAYNEMMRKILERTLSTSQGTNFPLIFHPKTSGCWKYGQQ